MMNSLKPILIIIVLISCAAGMTFGFRSMKDGGLFWKLAFGVYASVIILIFLGLAGGTIMGIIHDSLSETVGCLLFAVFIGYQIYKGLFHKKNESTSAED
jgi:uncharacterized membrane protein YfcA